MSCHRKTYRVFSLCSIIKTTLISTWVVRYTSPIGSCLILTPIWMGPASYCKAGVQREEVNGGSLVCDLWHPMLSPQWYVACFALKPCHPHSSVCGINVWEAHTQPFKSQASCKWKCSDLATLPPLTYELCFSSKKLPLLKVRSGLYKLLVAYFPFKKRFHFPYSVHTRSSQKHDTDPDSFLFFSQNGIFFPSLFPLLVPIIVLSELRRKWVKMPSLYCLEVALAS